MTDKDAKASVCMVVFSHYPADPRVRREAETLERAGIAVDVICLQAQGESPVEAFGGVTAYRVMKGTERKENIMSYFLHSTVFGFRAFAKLLSLSLSRKYSLVQAHNMPDFLVFAGLFHKLLGRPVVLDLHDLTVELFESRCAGKKTAMLKPFVRLLEKASCSFADGLITTSEGFRDRLLSRGIGQDKITLVLNTADNNIFSRPPARDWARTEGPRLLYHGTVARRFGLHVAIEAVPHMLKLMPDTTLNIYGKYDPSYKTELERTIRSLGLASRVKLGGYLSLDKVIDVIGESDIGVVPYLSDPFMDLALSTKVFEYVCMGMPVAASNVRSITSIFDEESICYFSAGSPEDLARRVETFWRSPGLRKSFTEKAAMTYEKISWPVMSERYLSKINSLIMKEPG